MLLVSVGIKRRRFPYSLNEIRPDCFNPYFKIEIRNIFNVVNRKALKREFASGRKALKYELFNIAYAFYFLCIRQRICRIRSDFYKDELFAFVVK